MRDRRYSRSTLPDKPQTVRAAVGEWHVELLPKSRYEARYCPDSAIIGFTFESQVGVHAFASDRRIGFRAGPNGLAFVPPGCDVFSQSDDGGEYLKITLDQKDFRQPPNTRRFSGVIDAAAIAAAHRLRCLLLSQTRVDPVCLERHVQTLRESAAQVVNGNHIPTRAGRWMTVHRQKRIEELIEARLDAKLTVQDLAKELCLSVGFFSRAFKAAFGKPPHDHIIDCRIARARSLLQSHKLDLTTVALSSGFASHAHMTATFHSRLGMAPSILRKYRHSMAVPPRPIR